MNLKRILTDPKAVLAAVAGGFLIGLFAEPVGAALYPFGSISIAFLSIYLIPILITAIVIGIARSRPDFFSTLPIRQAVADEPVVFPDIQRILDAGVIPATAIYVAIDPDIEQPNDIRIAVRPAASNLLRWVDLYLANYVGMLDDAEIVQRYLGREQESE